MNTMKRLVGSGVALLCCLLFTGKVYRLTEPWAEAMFRRDYGESWVKVLLFLWFLGCAAMIAAVSMYALAYLEIAVRARLSNGRLPEWRRR